MKGDHQVVEFACSDDNVNVVHRVLGGNFVQKPKNERSGDYDVVLRHNIVESDRKTEVS